MIETRGPQTVSHLYQLPIRGFSTNIHARRVLYTLEDSVSRTCTKFKTTRKSKCLVIKKGGVKSQVKMCFQDKEIQTIIDNFIKCLGFDESLTNRRHQGQVQTWLNKVDWGGLLGKYKALIHHH
jgi:hypothetical protein